MYVWISVLTEENGQSDETQRSISNNQFFSSLFPTEIPAAHEVPMEGSCVQHTKSNTPSNTWIHPVIHNRIYLLEKNETYTKHLTHVFCPKKMYFGRNEI